MNFETRNGLNVESKEGEGDLYVQCWGCGVGWWMDFEPEPYEHCMSTVFRLGVVQDGKIEFTEPLDENGNQISVREMD